MVFCRLVEFLIDTIPVRAFQDSLVRHHVQRCRRCEDRLVDRVSARLCLAGEDRIADDPAFVRKVRARAAQKIVSEAPGRPPAYSPLRWAAAVAGLVLVVGLGLWLVLDRASDRGRAGAENAEIFRINYLNVDGAPADTLVIQPRESNLVIIWVDREFRDGEPGGRA